MYYVSLSARLYISWKVAGVNLIIDKGLKFYACSREKNKK
jgi:hypothetical protein